MDLLAIARAVSVAVVFSMALLVIFEAPVGALWMPAIAATEAGYLVALLALPAFARGLGSPRDAAFAAIGAASVALLLVPLARAHRVAAELPRALDAAFGPSSAGGRVPFSPSRLLAFGSPTPAVETIPYRERAGEEPLVLDLYGGARPGEARPLVVMVHGGSWSGGDRHQLTAIARRLAGDGVAVASIEYGLAPRHPFPDGLEDVITAVDFLKARAASLGIDPERVVLYGRSAGGHLALLAAYRLGTARVRGVVALYAPTDMHDSWAHPTNPWVFDTPGTLRRFLGGAPGDSPAMHARYTAASPIAHVGPTTPPTLLVHGVRDEIVRFRHASRLAERLSRARVPHAVVALPWATHGCEASLAGPSGQLVEYAVRRFLASVAPDRTASAPGAG